MTDRAKLKARNFYVKKLSYFSLFWSFSTNKIKQLDWNANCEIRTIAVRTHEFTELNLNNCEFKSSFCADQFNYTKQ